MIIIFSRQIMKYINLTTILNDKTCRFPVDNLLFLLDYPITLGRKIFNIIPFSNLPPQISFTCKCNDSLVKKFFDNDLRHVMPGNLNVGGYVGLNNIKKKKDLRPKE